MTKDFTPFQKDALINLALEFNLLYSDYFPDQLLSTTVQDDGSVYVRVSDIYSYDHKLSSYGYPLIIIGTDDTVRLRYACKDVTGAPSIVTKLYTEVVYKDIVGFFMSFIQE